jgi:hypothetical protein
MKNLIVVFICLFAATAVMAKELPLVKELTRVVEIKVPGTNETECYGVYANQHIVKFKKNGNTCEFSSKDYDVMNDPKTFKDADGKHEYKELKGLHTTSIIPGKGGKLNRVWAYVDGNGNLVVRQESDNGGWKDAQGNFHAYQYANTPHTVELGAQGTKTTKSLTDYYKVEESTDNALKARNDLELFTRTDASQSRRQDQDWKKQQADKTKKLVEKMGDLKKASGLSDDELYKQTRVKMSGEVTPEAVFWASKNGPEDTTAKAAQKVADDAAIEAKLKAVRDEMQAKLDAERKKGVCKLDGACDVLAGKDCFKELLEKTGACKPSCDADTCAKQYRAIRGLPVIRDHGTEVWKAYSALASKKTCEEKDAANKVVSDKNKAYNEAFQAVLDDPGKYKIPSLECITTSPKRPYAVLSADVNTTATKREQRLKSECHGAGQTDASGTGKVD